MGRWPTVGSECLGDGMCGWVVLRDRSGLHPIEHLIRKRFKRKALSEKVLSPSGKSTVLKAIHTMGPMMFWPWLGEGATDNERASTGCVQTEAVRDGPGGSRLDGGRLVLNMDPN